VDFKTASKRPNGIAAEHGLQLTTYAMITPDTNGLCRLDTVTKTKTVQVIQQTVFPWEPVAVARKRTRAKRRGVR
jgi:hypothetical protein